MAIMEDYIIVVIQYVRLMNGSESRGCYHSAFHRIVATHDGEQQRHNK
ncbi:MAG: hypothetical protein M3270_04615 [Thermoproteota archaeon]|nr:hypothetical protein [Thermoproteota archaeon]